MKELLSSFTNAEVGFLRDKLKKVISSYSINKISTQEYQASVSQLLEAIGKNSTFNDEEKKLNDSLQGKVMNTYEKDTGIDKNKIEKNLKNK